MHRLERSVSSVIRAGHRDAWDYPVGIFRAAVEELEESLRGDV